MKKKYVLFDFDGVIADTEESNSHYLGLALKEFGVELTEKDKQRLIGTHDQELLIEFLSRAPRKVTVEQLKEIQDKYLVAGDEKNLEIHMKTEILLRFPELFR